MTPKSEHDSCVCALNEHEIAMMEERERLAELASKWIDALNERLGTDYCCDSMFEDEWFPMTPTCKRQLED
jgi:hypothetical protein